MGNASTNNVIKGKKSTAKVWKGRAIAVTFLGVLVGPVGRDLPLCAQPVLEGK